jgi:hypothetical protein
MKKFYFIQAPDSLVAGDLGNTVNHPFVLRFFFSKKKKSGHRAWGCHAG